MFASLNSVKAARERAANERYESIHPSIKEDIVEAAIWARETLTALEGEGHIINVVASCVVDEYSICSFAKSEWSADHTGDPMPTGSEAIVRAVCEYLEGM